jgi:hypothetical protein
MGASVIAVDLSERPDLNRPMTVAHPPVPKSIIRTRSRGAIAVERMINWWLCTTAGAFNAGLIQSVDDCARPQLAMSIASSVFGKFAHQNCGESDGTVARANFTSSEKQ